MKSFKIKNGLPHLVAIAVFFLLTALYFAPVFQGKDIMQTDAINSQGWGKDARDYNKESGEYSYWSNAMFSGMPSNYTFSPQPVNIFIPFEKVLTLSMFGASRRHIGVIFLTFVCFYIFLLSIGCKSWLSMVGSIAYTLCTYNFIIIEAGHMNKSLVMATMAPIIGGVILCYRGKLLWGALITLIFSGLNIYWSHQQISYYLLLVLIILSAVYLFYAIREKRVKEYLKSTTVLVVVAVLAVLPALGLLLPSADYAKESMRGGSVLKQASSENSGGLNIDYAYQWSYGIGETFTLLVPNLYGASSHYGLDDKSETYKFINRNYGAAQARSIVERLPMYWGSQPFTSGPVYIGAIVCFLFVLGLFIVKGREKWWLLFATVLSITMAWGKYFLVLNEPLFYYLPLYSKFRAPSMSLVIASLTMVTLGILAVKTIIKNIKDGDFLKSAKKSLLISLGITGGLCLLFVLFGSSMFDFVGASDGSFPPEMATTLRTDRASMLSADAWRSLIFILLSCVLLFLYLQKSFRTSYLVLMLGVLIFADLWPVDKRFLSWDAFMPKQKTTEILPTAADKQILADKNPNFRVFNLASSTFNDSRTSYFHKSIGGYSPAKLRRYQDIIDHYFSRNLNMNILNMLNVKYIITASEKGEQVVQQNPAALGNSWFVPNVQWTETPDEEIAAIADFDPSQIAFIEKSWQATLPSIAEYSNPIDSTDFITLAEYKNPGEIVYKSSSKSSHLAVFSEVFYKTWKAYIDGKEVPVVRVNYILRGLPIPSGDHTIEFKCVDEVMIQSARLSLYGSILVALVILSLTGAIIFKAVKKRDEN